MARNRRVQRAQLEMWLGFVGFFAFMSLVNLVGVFALGGGSLLPIVVALVLVGAFVWLFVLWRRDRERRE